MIPRDEIVEEVRAVRDAYAAQFNYDLDEIYKDLKAKETERSQRNPQLQPHKPNRATRAAK